MDDFLGKITGHAMNYAIRSGIGITATYAIQQSSRLIKTLGEREDHGDKELLKEFRELREQMNNKIKIISPSIDTIELVSARGNTSLETALTTTQSIRLDTQRLGTRLSNAATIEEAASGTKVNKSKSTAGRKNELRGIMQDMRKLISTIDDAVPHISLAIQTSGVRISTTMSQTVSPSRMLQASMFLNTADIQYNMNPSTAVQVGPTFILSLYMLFISHQHKIKGKFVDKKPTWKEVIHKARVKLMRIPLHSARRQWPKHSFYKDHQGNDANIPVLKAGEEIPMIAAEGKQNEFYYHIEIIEDLDDNRVHTFDDSEPPPAPYGDVALAGIKEVLPIHQISKIFYADTGKILNIGDAADLNSPVLLLKRDINAPLPRKAMPESENTWVDEEPKEQLNSEDEDDTQHNVDDQIRRESSGTLRGELFVAQSSDKKAWKLPPDVDTEWLALEVYTEAEDSDSDDEPDGCEDSAYISHRPSSSGLGENDDSLIDGLQNLNIHQTESPHPSPGKKEANPTASPAPMASLYGPIRSSLSLLEMLVRLTSLQEFQQATHLSTTDELLTFFLNESSTIGAEDSEQRRRIRQQAQTKVGFDPYDESPIKRHGEEYQHQNQIREGSEGYSRGGTPYDDRNNAYVSPQLRWSRGNTPHDDQNNGYTSPPQRRLSEQDLPSQGTPSPSVEEYSYQTPQYLRNMSIPLPFPPISPYLPQRKASRPLNRVVQGFRAPSGSPLGRGMSVETDSSLGTSPGSPKTVGNVDRGEGIDGSGNE